MIQTNNKILMPTAKDRWLAKLIYIGLSFFYYKWFGGIYPLDTIDNIGLIFLTIAFALLSTGILVAYLLGDFSEGDFDRH